LDKEKQEPNKEIQHIHELGEKRRFLDKEKQEPNKEIQHIHELDEKKRFLEKEQLKRKKTHIDLNIVPEKKKKRLTGTDCHSKGTEILTLKEETASKEGGMKLNGENIFRPASEKIPPQEKQDDVEKQNQKSLPDTKKK